jgi:plasmid stabilization system protein ParE
VNAIRKHLQILINNPEIGPRLSSHYDAVPTRFKETRFLVCGKYIAIYDYEAPLVKVIELYHGSQDYISSLFS